ncbi:hypothetical protein [Kineococcus sp. SYSU DK002]|uniref:hypothetical protein n=1 Tax=Kineococcus sp. SYSU DK002 TaxID=3383123 RepID=UPI003D7EEBAD
MYDLVNQRLTSFHHDVRAGEASTFQSPHRYVWPAEMDLMAQMAELSSTERWADWHQQQFTADSESHVSVWQKPQR